MQLLVIILKKSEVVDTLMRELARAGVHGGTVLESAGMAKSLSGARDMPIMLAIGEILEGKPIKNSKTIMIALPDERLEIAKNVVHEVCGDLSKPNAGVMFALPISFSEGIS